MQMIQICLEKHKEGILHKKTVTLEDYIWFD